MTRHWYIRFLEVDLTDFGKDYKKEQYSVTEDQYNHIKNIVLSSQPLPPSPPASLPTFERVPFSRLEELEKKAKESRERRNKR